MESKWVHAGVLVCLVAPLLAACGTDLRNEYPAPKLKYPLQGGGYSAAATQPANGLSLTRVAQTSANGNGENGGIGVNAYLWRATLENVSALPLTSADPFGGVILTDWYAPPESPSERRKLTILILDRQLRAEAIRVTVFRQIRGGDGGWTEAKADPDIGHRLEGAILVHARELRVADNGKNERTAE